MFKLFAKKSLGQNFLVNPGVVQRIIEAATLNSNEKVLEVGPGSGILTKELAARAGRVIAVEKDARAIEMLKKELPGTVTVIESDILSFDPRATGLEAGDYKVVANLPYYISTHFLRVMLEEWPAPTLAILMVQKEVAQRMMAKPPEMNLLALSVQYYAHVEKVMDVSPGSFRPMPTVDSTVIKLVPKNADQKHADRLFKVIRTGFSSKRKKLLNNLSTLFTKTDIILALDALQIRADVRAEVLSLSQWQELFQKLHSLP
jgi:16S rRNA (adenine1518-N6/adenine1519-N6)-dimethyltransferase